MEEYDSLKSNMEKLREQHLHSINIDYKREIDSLHYIDQNIIRGAKSLKGNYKIDKSNLPNNLFDLDSLVFKHLLALIDKHGFPSEENIGSKGYRNAQIIFHHNARLPQNAQYLSMLKEALYSGFYLPHDYAWMYDQGLAGLANKSYTKRREITKKCDFVDEILK